MPYGSRRRLPYASGCDSRMVRLLENLRDRVRCFVALIPRRSFSRGQSQPPTFGWYPAFGQHPVPQTGSHRGVVCSPSDTPTPPECVGVRRKSFGRAFPTCAGDSTRLAVVVRNLCPNIAFCFGIQRVYMASRAAGRTAPSATSAISSN